MTTEYEFSYTDDNFYFIKNMTKKMTGVNLEDTKKEMVFSRISRIIRKYDIKTFDEYCHILEKEVENENSIMMNEFVSAITTHLTFFMREKHHFDFIKNIVFPKLINDNANRIRMWSAGCSTGEEPYSLAFCAFDALKNYRHIDCKILATDIDSEAVNKSKSGIYSSDSVAQLQHTELTNYFDLKNNQYMIKPIIQQMIYFKVFNLMSDSWPMSGPFDVIFCRNVLIYFDRETQNKLISRYIELLREGGHLILGHSESIGASHKNLKFLDKTIYRRIL